MRVHLHFTLFSAVIVVLAILLFQAFTRDTQEQADMPRPADQQIVSDSEITKLQPTSQDRMDQTASVSSQPAVNVATPSANTLEPDKAVPLWSADDVIDQDGGYSSEWVATADVLSVVNLPKNLTTRFQVGSSFSLPAGENPQYIVEEKKDMGEGGTSWLVVNAHTGTAGRRYGVISEGNDLLLMTLYTDRGVYYVRSGDKTTAEVSFVNYTTLERKKATEREN